MKLLNILGAVVAVHVAVLVLAVAIPGCRSTNSSSPVVESTPEPSPDVSFEPVPQSSPISAAPELTDADLNPPVAGDGISTFDPNAPAVAASAPSSSGRYSPTRPQSASTQSLQAPAPVQTAPSTTYTVVRGDNLWSLAKRNDLSVRELASANNLRPDAGLRIGQVLVIPGKTIQPTVTAAAASAPAESSISYLIQPGDTLAVIARRHNVTVAQLKAFNNLRSDLVRAGDRLAIPEQESSNSTEPTPAARTTTASTATTTPTAARSSGGVHTHVVSPGESLTVIANRYQVSIGSIALANQIRDPSLIRPGQELKIPGATVPKPTTPGGNISATAASRASSSSPIPTLEDSSDLDEGLDDADLQNVPVIQVEEEDDDFDDEPIKTIGAGGDASDSPPLFN